MTTPDRTAPPAPPDDGAAGHLPGLVLPDLALPSTDGAEASLGAQPGLDVLLCYPMTGRPGTDLPAGWDDIPGARGRTPQACAYRDGAADLAGLGVDGIWGISTQDGERQREAARRLSLPFALLSDHALAIGLPRFEADGATCLGRLTMIVKAGTVRAVHYPVFPPDADPGRVRGALASQPRPR